MAVAALVWAGLSARGDAHRHTTAGPGQTLPATGRPLMALAAAAPPLASASAAPPGDAPAQAFDRWVAEHSALRGSALDGGWGLDVQGRLQPSLALRRRFDHLLQLTGQAPMDRITDLVARQARAELHADDVAGVLNVWHAYLGLLADPGRSAPRAGEAPVLPGSTGWAAAVAERHQLRRQWLGAAWAAAFYAEEEAALAVDLANGSPAPELIDRTALPPDALQRLADEQARQARWQQSLTEAREEVRRLRASPELSAPLRDASLERLVEERFAPGSDRVRARALLGLPPG